MNVVAKKHKDRAGERAQRSALLSVLGVSPTLGIDMRNGKGGEGMGFFEWWQRPEEPQEPERSKKAGRSPEEPTVYSYYGPDTEQYFKVTVYMQVVPPDGGAPFPAHYSVIVPDYNMSPFTDTLNENRAVYTVHPLIQEED